MILSVIVPTYNKEEKIVRCLESLRSILAEDVEFIIVNDGSTDGTKDVCEKFINHDSRFLLINKENSGVSGARNTGLKNSKGKYISFVDADDEITSEYNQLIDLLREEKYCLYGFDYCAQKKNQTIICRKSIFRPGENNHTVLYNSFLMGLSNSVCMNVYKANIIHDNYINFTEGMVMGEDCEFNSKFLQHCKSIYYYDKVCYRYFVDDDDSATHQRKLNYLEDFEKMYQAYLNVYQLEDGLKFPFDYQFYMNFVYGIIKKNSAIMTREQNREFRNSTFYKVLTSKHYKNKKVNLKKMYIKWNLYRIFR